MDALTVLLWILAGIGGIVLLSIVAVFIALLAAAIYGLRLMRDDEAAELPGRGTR